MAEHFRFARPGGLPGLLAQSVIPLQQSDPGPARNVVTLSTEYHGSPSLKVCPDPFKQPQVEFTAGIHHQNSLESLVSFQCSNQETTLTRSSNGKNSEISP